MKTSINIKNNRSVIKALLLLAIVYTAAVLPNSSLNAQMRPSLGKVWDKMYDSGAGKVYNVYPNKQDQNYTAIATVGSYLGKVYEIDEAGTQLREFTCDVRDWAYRGETGVNGNFGGVTLEGGIAFKTNDGGVLAFFNVYDKGRAAIYRQPDWNGQANQLKRGVWIVKFSNNGTVESNRIDRGTAILEGLQLSDGRFMVGGLDENLSNDIGESKNVTLLRVYSQAGVKAIDYRGDNPSSAAAIGTGFNIKEVVSIHMQPKNSPNDPDRIFIATIHYLASIDNINQIYSPASSYPLKNKIIGTMPGNVLLSNPNIQTMTPTADGGVFVETLIKNDDNPANAYLNGRVFIKFRPQSTSYAVAYAYLFKPSSTLAAEYKYDTPYLLPHGNYGGILQYKSGYGTVSQSYIYELKDNYTNAEINPASTTSPNTWAPLDGDLRIKRSSNVDGFFAAGSDMRTYPFKANMIKLSTCANFAIPNIPPRGYFFVKPRANFFIKETFRYVGAAALSKDNVTHNLKAVVYSGTVNGFVAGETIYDKSGTAINYIPNATQGASGDLLALDDKFTVSGNQPAVEYTLRASDKYLIDGVEQTCQQTTVFYLVQELVGGATQGPLAVNSGSTLTSPLYVDNSSGGFGPNSYQWQELVSGTWVSITGATSETFLPMTSLTANKTYRRSVSNIVGTEFSTPFTVNVSNSPDIDIVSLPTGVMLGNDLIVETAIRNISPVATSKTFKITLYKETKGAAKKVTFTDTVNRISYNDTRHFKIVIPNYLTDWAGTSKVIVSFNDSGNGAQDQTAHFKDNVTTAELKIKN